MPSGELVLDRLQAFGGIARVAAEFRAAACLEERCNWFCILLDYTDLPLVSRYIAGGP